MTASEVFKPLSRQQFRRFFQPSRVLLGVVPAPTKSGFNVITLCFNMHCSYKPPMMAVAIHNRSVTYRLIMGAPEYVLSVPGADMAAEAMQCGLVSNVQEDKVERLQLELVKSTEVAVPGLKHVIANLEMRKTAAIETGDHLLVVGQVLRFSVNTEKSELPLLSFGPDQNGFRLLERQGIHRLGTIQI